MWGGDDPDERKPLWWEELKFNKETRTNIKPGKKEYDSVGFNRDVFEYYKRLIKIRKENQVLSNGNLEFIKAEGDKLIYKRQNKNDVMYIFFNLNKNHSYSHSIDNGKYTDLLSEKESNGSVIEVAPFSAMILKKTE